MNPIDATFSRLRSTQSRAFLPFLTAGDPDIAATPILAQALIDAGANLIEIGFPYSDPIADGPVIQASYTRALDRGLHMDQVFAAARQISSRNPGFPLLAMTSYSLVFRRGVEDFLQKALRAGFAGVIVPDLPVEESEGLARHCADRDFKLIQLVTPTTSRDRAKRILELCSGFVYCVSVTGITGVRARIPPELIEQLHWLRSQTKLPLCVGFGVSLPEHARLLRDHADGVIVGSALVRLLEGPGGIEEIASRLAGLTRDLVTALQGPD